MYARTRGGLMFVSLHNHTELGSPLDGMNDVRALLKRAKMLGHPGIAITDHGTMTAIYDAWKISKEIGIKFIPGIEIYFTTDFDSKKSNHLVLLAKNEVGYRNILTLNYLAYKNQVNVFMGKKIPRISWEHIEKYNEGVIALSACHNGLIAKTLITEGDRELAINYIQRYRSIFKDGFYLELQPHALKDTTKDGKPLDQVLLNNELLSIAEEFDIPYVITCDAHYLDSDSAKYHDCMLAIKDNKALDDPDRFRYGVKDMYLKAEEEIIDFFGKRIATKGMDNTVKILQMCEEPDYIAPKGAILPRFPVVEQENYNKFALWKTKVCPNIDDDKAYLRYLCIEGFKRRFPNINKEDRKIYWNRVQMELSILEKRDFSSYMLIVADYIKWAKTVMPVGPGRGSVSGSLVAFLADITDIDPIKYGLIFERFHNKEKKSFPDIDTDFANPSLVKDYLKEKYGEDKVASISNWSTLTPKQVIKDVARSLRIGGDKSSAFQISNYITSIMPDASTIEEAREVSKEFDSYMYKYPDLYLYASKLQNLTRNFGVHAAGVVLSDRPLHEIVPLRIDDDGNTVVQWEKNRCEENGFVKYDLLGLKTLNVIEDALNIINERNNSNLSIVNDIDIEDPKPYEMIARGGTSGVFQLESSLTPFCIRLKPKDIEDLSAINALGRPSCLPAERKRYISRRLGVEDKNLEHPSMERALGGTEGVLLYEESAMYIAQDCAGWDLNRADAMRKISKLKEKGKDLALKTEAEFVKDVMRNLNMSYSNASNMWKKYIEPMSGYSFNKSLLISEEINIIRNRRKLTLPINKIQANDLVRTRDEKTQKDFYTKVKDLHYHGTLPVYEITLDTGEEVRCTMNHKFRTTNGKMLPLWLILKENLDIVVSVDKK